MTMNDVELCFAPATELARLIREKRLSPVELIDAVLHRIMALEPQLNAFAHLAPEVARSAAQAAETAVMQGAPLGPLHGIPVTIKDLEPVGGMPFEQGSYVRRGEIAPQDGTLVT